MENNSSKEDIIKKYKNKSLAFTIYTGGRGDYFVKDFIDFDYLNDVILEEIYTGESDITKSGIEFLKEYYGFQFLAEKLHDIKWNKKQFSNTKDLIKFLESMKPYFGMNFITNVREAEKLTQQLINNPTKLMKVLTETEVIIQSIDNLYNFYLKLADKEKINFIIVSYKIAHSLPDNTENFIDNLKSKIKNLGKNVKLPDLELYSTTLYKYLQPKNSFPVNEN